MKICRFSNAISYFCSRKWKFTNNNVQGLWQKLNEGDKKLFDFDIGGLDWDKYFYNYVRGVRVHLMKEDPSTIPQGITRQKR
jgi:fatty acyl-CoA reductase